MESKVVIVHADKMPMQGVANPGPHQTYQNPHVKIIMRDTGILNPDEIRVEMKYAGLCGTDVHLVETDPATKYIRCSAPLEIPPEGRLIGHEGVGRVLEVGTNVRHLKPGAYVTFESIIVCHYCEVCRRGQFNQCANARLLGLEKDGIFGTIVDVPAMLAHDITGLGVNDKVLKAAACIEPAGVAYVACENSHIAPGSEVVIFGAGPIGVLSSMLSKLIFGASMVHIVEPIEFRRKYAQKWCDHVYDTDEFFNHDSPKSIDVVIEASGNMNNVSRIFRRMNANGRIVLLGRSGGQLVIDSIDHMITNEVSIVGSRGHLCGAFANILSLYEKKRIPLDEIVTSIVNGPEGIKDILEKPQMILKENCKVLARFDA